jgi:hypothetical protein
VKQSAEDHGEDGGIQANKLEDMNLIPQTCSTESHRLTLYESEYLGRLIV